jgi:hypothetical protein
MKIKTVTLNADGADGMLTRQAVTATRPPAHTVNKGVYEESRERSREIKNNSLWVVVRRKFVIFAPNPQRDNPLSYFIYGLPISALSNFQMFSSRLIISFRLFTSKTF